VNTSATDTELKKVTIRGRGKAHRGLIRTTGERQYLIVACSCPGSQRGTLEKKCVIIADGWEKANCGH
jgi:hypothetical protein